MSLLRTASFFAKPHSGGRRLQLQLQAAGFQTSAEDADHGREGGGAVVNSEGGLEDPTNNNELGPDADADVSEAALLRKMRTGRGRAGAEALELFQSDATWNRAQYLLLLGAEGPSLLGRDEAVMASKEWAGRAQNAPTSRVRQEGETRTTPKGGSKRREGQEGQGRQRQGSGAAEVAAPQAPTSSASGPPFTLEGVRAGRRCPRLRVGGPRRQ